MNVEEITGIVLQRISEVKDQLTMEYSSDRYKQQRNIELRRKRTLEASIKSNWGEGIDEYR